MWRVPRDKAILYIINLRLQTWCRAHFFSTNNRGTQDKTSLWFKTQYRLQQATTPGQEPTTSCINFLTGTSQQQCSSFTFQTFCWSWRFKFFLHFFSFYVKTKIFLISISENQVPNLFPPTYKSVLVRQTFGRLKFEKPCCSLLLSPPQPPQHKTKMSFGLKREILLPRSWMQFLLFQGFA